MEIRFYNNDRSIYNQPKIKAHKLIKFPETPKIFIIIIAKSIAKGMTEATKNLRENFRGIKRTKTTINAPSKGFFDGSNRIIFTILVRSRNASIFTPSGKVFGFLHSGFYFAITSLEFAPFIIITTAPATSPLPL